MAGTTTNAVDSLERIQKFNRILNDYLRDAPSLVDPVIGMLVHRENVNDIPENLDKDLCSMIGSDGWGLLHHAAAHNKADMARILIEKGSNVDLLGKNNETPLMTAVRSNSTKVVSVLLEAKADIDFADTDGNSALQVLFTSRFVGRDIIDLLFRRVQRRTASTPSTQEYAKRLIAAGSMLYHAAILDDLDLLECMLNHGVHVNSRGFREETALHAVVRSNRLDLVKWLVEKGADVNARDDRDKAALFYAAENAYKDIVLILLQRGADPNERIFDCETSTFGVTALCYAVATPLLDRSAEPFEECIEILLQHGANPQIQTTGSCAMFYWAYRYKYSGRINIVLAHLAMLERLGTPITAATRADIDKYTPFLEYYQLCQQIFEIKVFKSLTLLDLLRATDHKMETYLRNQEFLLKLLRIYHNHELKIKYRYYFNTLKKRVSNILRLKKMRYMAAQILYQITSERYTVCDVIVERVESYLTEKDLKILCELN